MSRVEHEEEFAHLGESRGCEDHDHDLVHELSKKLDALWRYDQYISNAAEKPDIQELWRDLRRQDRDNIKRLKELLTQEVRSGCF
ncbi:hypothetical protein HY522_11485 [bacterium]|nr:hypothetical protein [bacterium]